MVDVKTGVHPDRVRQQASHRLFVEGESDESFDVQVIQALLDRSGVNIKVQPLGPSYRIRGAAEALHCVHPDYYFLIDRDHQDDTFVEKCWKKFPDPKQCNLLVWRRRELESYFIIPEYLCQSDLLKRSKTKADLEEAILASCSERLYLDAANLVIISIREDLKHRWIKRFGDSDLFSTEGEALSALKARPEWCKFGRKAGRLMGESTLRDRLHEAVTRLTGGLADLEYGQGRWLELIKGKPVFGQVVNQFFDVKDNMGRYVQGSERQIQVAKSLFRQEVSNMPGDFVELQRLIEKRVSPQ